MFKRLFNWIFDIDEVKTTAVLSRSVSGIPLLTFRSSWSRWSVTTTDAGIKGSHIAITITQLGENVEKIKQVLRREHDDCLSAENYEHLVLKIEQRIADGGYYWETKRNREGHLHFYKVMWTDPEMKEIAKLLEEYRS